MEKILEYSTHYNIYLEDENFIETSDGGVYKGIDSESSKCIACKMINVSDDYKNAYNQAYSEMSALRRLEKEFINVPRIYGIKEDNCKSQIWLLMEWIEGKTLREVMINGISNMQFLDYLDQLSDILIVLEKCKISHKDIKPENIIINRNEKINNEKVFLIDFDISLNLAIRGEGTESYRAPEMWNTSSIVNRDCVDIYSIGVIMYEYFTGVMPRRGIELKADTFGGNEWKVYVEPKEIKPEVSDDLNFLIKKLMQYDYRKRLNASELKRELRKIIKLERGKEYGKRIPKQY